MENQSTTSKEHTSFTTSLAQPSDAHAVVDLSARVQAALSASPDRQLQVIGPLRYEDVETAIHEQRCYVLAHNASREIVGITFIRPLASDVFARTPDFVIEDFARPWCFIHSVMLDPSVQDRRIGLPFMAHVLGLVGSVGGTVFLDCWHGNYKLREVYTQAGFRYVATVLEPGGGFEVAMFAKDLGEGKR